jgi:hypothetical protein
MEFVAVTETTPSSNFVTNPIDDRDPTALSSQTPRGHLISKVLKRLKNKKWRKRRSRTASEALSESGGQFTFSESDSVTSSVMEESLNNIIEEEHDYAQQEDRYIAKQSAADESCDSVTALAVLRQSTSSITVNSFTQPNYPSTTTTVSNLALRGDLDDWRKSVVTGSSMYEFFIGFCYEAGSLHSTYPMLSFLSTVKTAHALLASNEMKAFLQSSNRMVTSAIKTSAGTALTASGMVVKTAFLPVTFPLNVVASTTDLFINVAGDVIRHVTQDEDDIDRDVSRDKIMYHTPAQNLLHNAFNFIPFMVQNAIKIVTPSLDTEPRLADGVGICATRMLPSSKKGGKEQLLSLAADCSVKEESPDAFLHRLRLDVYPNINEEFKMTIIRDVRVLDDDDATTKTDTTETSASSPSSASGATKSDFSKFLLRVDDVNVLAPPNPACDKVLRAIYVDLDSEFGDERITKDALSQLVQRGIDVASSNPAVDFHCTPIYQAEKSNISEIEWKPEGKTKRDLIVLSSLSRSDFFDALRNKVLIWSGKYRGPKYHGSDNALFMARGIVNGSPRHFTTMLWDSSRTREYNNYCLGRKDIVVINDEFSNGGSYGAKVIKSETQVPFTSLSVFLSAVMHTRAIGDRPEDGYMIFSRSLNTGQAGCHVERQDTVDQSNKNEIILGVNVMRPVPGHPELTDLISVSQVSACMVPPFLAFRIGMMGVEDFFKNVRA